MRRVMYVVAAAVVLAPAIAEAQRTKKRSPTRTVRVVSSDRDCCWGNRFSLEPYAGAMRDAYDASPDDENTGYLIGFRVGYMLSSRTRLLGNVGYSKSDDVANSAGVPAYTIYDNEWVFTTGGAEFDVVPGRTSAALGLQGGVAWRRLDFDGFFGAPGTEPAPEGFTAYEVIIPSLVARHRLSSRATFSVGLHDNIFDFLEGPARHSLALTAGIAFR